MGVDLGDGTWATRDPATGDILHVVNPMDAVRATFNLSKAIEAAKESEKAPDAKDALKK